MIGMTCRLGGSAFSSTDGGSGGGGTATRCCHGAFCAAAATSAHGTSGRCGGGGGGGKGGCGSAGRRGDRAGRGSITELSGGRTSPYAARLQRNPHGCVTSRRNDIETPAVDFELHATTCEQAMRPDLQPADLACR